MRSARASVASTVSPMRTASTSARKKPSRTKNGSRTDDRGSCGGWSWSRVMGRTLEGHHRLEHAGEPAHRLRLVDVAGAAILDARVGDGRRRHLVPGEDEDRIDHARETDELGALVDADLLLAGDEQ